MDSWQPPRNMRQVLWQNSCRTRETRSRIRLGTFPNSYRCVVLPLLVVVVRRFLVLGPLVRGDGDALTGEKPVDVHFGVRFCKPPGPLNFKPPTRILPRIRYPRVRRRRSKRRALLDHVVDI